MRHTTFTTLLTLAASVAASDVDARQVSAERPANGAYDLVDSLETRVWLDRGEEPVVEPGDEVRVYYRTSADAFAAIFRIDTDGRITLLFPHHPDADSFVSGGRDYRLLFPDSPRWRVREDPGVGYFFMVASPEPLDFSAFGFDAEYGWDLSGVGERVYEDPYVAIDDYVAVILPTWDTTPYALDFLSYSVGEEHDYPRFLCYDCHDFRGYSSWNPYDYACSSFQVVIWDDPYFYPRYRYAGTRVVFARPLGPRPRYTVTTRIVGMTRGPIVRTRPAPPRRTAIFKESPRSGFSARPGRVPSAGARVAPGATSPRPRPSTRLGSRPDLRAPGRAGPGSGRSAAPSERPTLQRRQPPAATPRSTPPDRSSVRPPPRRPGGGGSAGRAEARPPASRVRPPRAQARPPASQVRPPRSQARPPASRVRPPRAQARPGGASGARPSPAPRARASGGGVRPGVGAPSRPPRGPGARPSPPSRVRPAPPSRAGPRPSRPTGPGGRPPAKPPGG